tara:strand:+ start:288 stop:512 length:225 start_codon:yes stop_codon:yes gene_type:complete
MARKNNKGKPTRKDIETALAFIGKKLQYLEQLSVSTENIIDAYINFKEDKDAFLKYLEKKFPAKEEKEVVKTEE